MPRMRSRWSLLLVLIPALVLSTLASPVQDGATPDALYMKALAILSGADPDFAQAATLLKQAADQGLPRAQRTLGGLYRDGKGVAKDDAAAVDLFRKAADKGDAIAQTDLGNMYMQGVGVQKDVRA